jgi:hypothetical protein
LLGALAIIDVYIDPIPADEAALLVVNGSRGYLEPAIFSIGATEADFRLPRLAELLELTPPLFELFHVVPVKLRFPVGVNFVGRTTAVVKKSLIEEFRRAIRKSRPGKRWNAIDKSEQFQRIAI